MKFNIAKVEAFSWNLLEIFEEFEENGRFKLNDKNGNGVKTSKYFQVFQKFSKDFN